MPERYKPLNTRHGYLDSGQNIEWCASGTAVICITQLPLFNGSRKLLHIIVICACQVSLVSCKIVSILRALPAEMVSINSPYILIMIITINRDSLPPPRRGSHVKSTNTQTTNIHILAHILDICDFIFSSCTLFTVYLNRIMLRHPTSRHQSTGGRSERTQGQAKMAE